MRNWGKKAKAWLTPRRRKTLGGVVVVAGLLFGLARYTGGPKMFLDYLKVLVWPLVLATSAWWLRDVFRDKLRELYEFALPGGAMAKFRQEQQAELASQAASHEVAPAAKVLVEDEWADPAYAAANAHRAKLRADGGLELADPTEADEAEKREARERARRAAWEKTFREGAEWGWKLSRIGFKSAPVPQVDWDGDEPVISHAMASVGDDAGRRTAARRRARDLEIRISYLISKIEFAGDRQATQKDLAELKHLRTELRDLDPDSQYLYLTPPEKRLRERLATKD